MISQKFGFPDSWHKDPVGQRRVLTDRCYRLRWRDIPSWRPGWIAIEPKVVAQVALLRSQTVSAVHTKVTLAEQTPQFLPGQRNQTCEMTFAIHSPIIASHDIPGGVMGYTLGDKVRYTPSPMGPRFSRPPPRPRVGLRS